MSIENKQNKNLGNGNGTNTGYAIEARIYSIHMSPQVSTSGQIFDHEWRKVQFEKSKGVGIPVGYDPHHFFSDYGYSSYVGAEALRYWFHAMNESKGFETRIQKVKITYSYSIEEIGNCLPLDGLLYAPKE